MRQKKFVRYSSLTVTLAALAAAAPAAAQTVNVGGTDFTNQGLFGVGRIAANSKDLLGETLGSVSALAFDAKSWRRNGDSYSGTLFTLPDRGYNVVGTTDYRPRIEGFGLTFTPFTGTSTTAQNQVQLQLQSTLLLTDQNGLVMSGLDPAPGNAGGVRAATGNLPALPQAPNGKISLDPEGLVRLSDGSFWVSDEYGPYIYRFSATGQLLQAIRPPEALIPKRNGVDDFRSNNPGPGVTPPTPADPLTGRQNNQGFEGLTLSADGTRLSALLQSAARQDGGTGGTGPRNYTRLLTYDVSSIATPKLVSEYVVRLPTDGSNRVAAQSEMLALNERQFLVLSRDSGNGYGLSANPSLYRSIDIVDTSGATNIAGTAFDGATPIAPGGVLTASITPVTYRGFLNINDSAQLARYGLRNGGLNDRNNLSEKWEALGLVPVLDPARLDDFFLFVGNDNDFLTTDGFQVGAPYSDPGGSNVDTLLLVYRLTLPTYVDPLAVDQMQRSALPFAFGLAEAGYDLTRTLSRDPGGRLFTLRAGLQRSAPIEVWGQAGYDRTKRTADNAGSFAPSNRYVQGGVDVALANGLRLGAALGRATSESGIAGVGNSDMKATTAGVYLSAVSGPFWADLAWTHSFLDAEKTERPTYYGLTARGDTSGRGDVIAANAGWNFDLGRVQAGPTFGIEYAHAGFDGWTERDALHLNVIMPSASVRSLTYSAGLQASLPIEIQGGQITPQLRIGYDVDALRDNQVLTAVLANRTTSVLGTTTGNFQRADQDGATAGFGVAAQFGRASLILDYDHKFQQNGHHRDNVAVSVRIGF